MSQRNPTEAQIDAYAAEYVMSGKQSDAWRAAFPKTKAKLATINQRALEFHRIGEVRVRIAEMRLESRTVAADEFTVTVADKKRILAKVAKLGLKESKNLSAVVSSMAELNRMDGDHAAEKREVTRKDNNHINKIEIMVVGANDTN